MKKIAQRIVTLLLVVLLTCGMFPAVFATDAAPEDTATEETILVETETDPTEPIESAEPTDSEDTAVPVTEESQAVETDGEILTATPIYINTGIPDTVPMLMAVNEGIMLAAESELIGTHYQRAIIWLTASEKLKFTYNGVDYSKSSLCTHGVLVDGKRYLAYCIDPGVSTTESGSAYSGSETAWTDLDINTQTAIGLAVLYGAPNSLYSTDKKTQLTYELATQIVIHEIRLGYRSNLPPYACSNSNMIDRMTYGNSNYFREISSMVGVYSSLHGERMDKALLREAYNTISASLASHYVLPSFASRYNSAAKTYEMIKQSDGTYAVTLTDTDKILSDCTFKDGNGLTYQVSGNKLTITASTAFTGTKSCALSGNAGVSKNVPNVGSETFLLWNAGKYQRFVSLQEPVNDPLPLYFNVKISNPNGTVKIVKKATNGGNTKGWPFEIKDSTGVVVGNYTTDADGLIAAELPAGTYTVTETASKKTYWINDETPSRTITVKAGETATVTFTNQYIGRVKIIKELADASIGTVEGWMFEIYSGKKVDTTKLVATVTTNEDGIITKKLEPGTYTIVEQIPDDCLFYCADPNPQTITVKAGKTTSITFTNAMWEGRISVLKVDDTGSARAGAEFLLEYSADNGKTWTPAFYAASLTHGGCTTVGLSDGVLVTDDTGLLSFTGLHPELRYRLTEIKAPEGYQMLTEPVFEGKLPNDQDYTVGFTVVNMPVFRLPATGSKSLFLAITGMALCCITCLGVICWLRKKEA